MEMHYGKSVEKFVRRNGYSISELARLTNVNRRVVYTWFNQQYLKRDIIVKIGEALDYDFSKEFPDLFSNEKKRNVDFVKSEYNILDDHDVFYWKSKYIDLLEKYKELLIINSPTPKANFLKKV